MNIIIISHMFPNNLNPMKGIFVKEQVLALKNAGANIIVISPIPYAPKILWFRKKWRDYATINKTAILDNITVYYPRYLVLPSKYLFGFQSYFMYFSVKRFLSKNNLLSRVNIIHAHTAIPDGYVSGRLKKLLRNVSTVLTVHGSDIYSYPFRNRLSLKLTKYALKNNDAVITVSDRLKEKVFAIYDRNVEIITNGVSQEHFYIKEKDMLELNIIKNQLIGKRTILFVGNIIKPKGVIELFEAFVKIAKKYPDLYLVYIGEGDQKNYLLKKALYERLNNRIFLTGLLEHDKVKLWFSACDIFILPSYSEGMPTVMFEAMLHKKPIIISDVGGVSEVIIDKINGLLIQPGNIDSICNKITELLDNIQLSEQISNNAYKDVISKYTWEINSRKMMTLYEKLES